MFKWLVVGLMACTVAAERPASLPVVSIAEVKTSNIKPTLSVPGTTQAINGASLSLENSGIITKIYAKSGQMVKKGELLLVLDDSAQKASLGKAKTAFVNAEIEYNRQAKLFKQGVVSAETFEQAEVKLADAKSNLISAEVALEYRKLRAPFDGKVGLVYSSIGQYVQGGESLFTLQSLEKMRVNFSVSQQDIPRLKKGQQLTILNPIQNMQGTVSALDIAVNSATGQFSVQGDFDNKGLKLPVGMLVDVNVMLNPIKDQMLIPASAVIYSLYGNFVYVVDGIKKGQPMQGTASRVLVELGETSQGMVIVKKGLEAGQKVVAAGTVKLTGNELPVQIDTQHALPKSLSS